MKMKGNAWSVGEVSVCRVWGNFKRSSVGHDRMNNVVNVDNVVDFLVIIQNGFNGTELRVSRSKGRYLDLKEDLDVYQILPPMSGVKSRRRRRSNITVFLYVDEVVVGEVCGLV